MLSFSDPSQKKKKKLKRASAAGESVAAYGRAAHPLGDRGGLCVAQHGLYNWERPGLYSFFMCRVTMRVAKIVVEIEAFLVEDIQRAC